MFGFIRKTSSIVLIAMVCLLAACKQVLLADLDERQANQAIALLQQHEVQANKVALGKGRFQVEVEPKQFGEAVDLLETYQVPSRKRIDIADLFPSDSLVNTPSAERARLISAIEQRLEQTITAIQNIVSARVHISYPLSDNLRVTQPMRVSIMVIGQKETSDALLTERIKRLAKNSFADLDYDNISVVFFEYQDIKNRQLETLNTDKEKISSNYLVILTSIIGLCLLGGSIFGWRYYQSYLSKKKLEVLSN